MKIERIVVVFVGATLACSSGGDDGLERVVLTSEVGSYSQPAYSPDGTRLAFVRSHEGEQTIWTTAPDGSDAKRMTEPSAIKQMLNWSPDSRTLAYASDAGEGLQDIWTVSTNTGEATPLTMSGMQVWPRFSPDGSRILFVRFNEGSIESVVMPVEGGEPRPMGSGQNVDAEFGMWSPDATRIAFQSQKDARVTISVVASDGGGASTLTSDGFEFLVEWSPDGSELLYVSRRTGLGDIWTIPSGGGTPRQITTDIRNDGSPTYSPDGAWIAYLSERGGQDDVWIVPSAGGESIRVTNDAAEESGLTWNPDGKGLTYVYSEQVNHIYSVPAEGGEIRQLTTGDEDQLAPQISPDGKWIAYEIERGGTDNVYIMDLDGGEPRPLVEAASDDNLPRWSPDGSMVAFLSYRGGPPGVWVVPAEGGAPRRISPEGHVSQDFRWSPDGDWISFQSTAAGGIVKIMVAPAQGGEARLVADMDFAQGAEWSPDGNTLAFSVLRNEGDDLVATIYRVPAAGGTPIALTSDNLPDGPEWSPDGSMIAFVGSLDGSQGDIYVMDADGSNIRQLTDHPADEANPQWSPDGSEIRFATQQNGSRDIAAVSVVGGDVRMIAETPLNVGGSGHLSPDGSTIVFVGTPVGNQLVSVNIARLLEGEMN